MRLRSLIIAIAALATGALAVLAAGYLVLRSIDLDAYLPEILAKVKSATGRELTIDGALEIGVREGLVIRVSDVSLGNAPWGSRPRMLTLGRAEAQVALLPLLAGNIDIKAIRLHDVDLLLETGPSGTANWQLGIPESGNGGAGVALDTILIQSGRLTWRTGALSSADALQFEQLELKAQLQGDSMLTEASAIVDGDEIALSGNLPAPRAWTSGQPIDLDLRLTGRAGEIEGSGQLVPEPWGLSPTLTLSASALDLAALGRYLRRPFPALPPLDVAFTLTGEAEGWTLTALEARAGASDVNGELRLSTQVQPWRLTGKLASHRLDLAMLPLADPSSTTDRPHGGPIFSTVPLNLGVLRTWDAAIQARVDRLTGRGYQLRDVRVDGELRAGRLMLKPIRAAVAGGGQIDGSVTLDVATTPPQWNIDLTVRQITASALLGSEQAALIQAPADLVLTVQTRGASPKQMAGSVSGNARLSVGAGRAHLKTIDTLVGGLSTLTGQLLAEGSADAQLNCAIADFALRQGVAQATVLLIDSAVSTVRGDGSIDVGGERIDLIFTPRPKRPTLSVAVPVHVRGPLRKPQFSADRQASLTKLIGVAGIFIYPPAALATLGDLGTPGDPCVELIRGGNAPGQPSSVVEQIQDGATGTVRSLGRGLKNLFDN